MYCRMGSHFHDWIDFNGVAVSISHQRVTLIYDVLKAFALLVSFQLTQQQTSMLACCYVFRLSKLLFVTCKKKTLVIKSNFANHL